MFKNGFFNKIFNNNISGSNNNVVTGNNVTSINGIRKGMVNINGQTFVGDSVTINNGEIFIDGKHVDVGKQTNLQVINIKIDGDVSAVSTGSGDVTVRGRVDKVTTGSGDVSVSENVTGNINTGSGDVDITGTVYGYVKTGSGDITYKK